jgi:regulator of nucleoside diphosphate kinase
MPSSNLDYDVRAAAVAALAVARWEAADLLSRRPPELVPDLLDGRAVELALSPLGADQVLSLVLEAGARDLRAGRPVLADGVLFLVRDGPPDAAARRAVRQGVPRRPADVFVRDLELVEELEARHRATGVAGAALAERLIADARLHAALWDDPRIPAGPAVRRLMRASVPLILDRVRRLDPTRVRAARRRPRSAQADAPALDPTTLRRPPILIAQGDLARLEAFAFEALLSDPRAAAPLLREIRRASVTPDDALPPDVVRLGSWVEYSEPLAGRTGCVKLVADRPQRDPYVLSVLTAVGAALIGLSVGQSILWQDHVGLQRLVTVRSVRPAGSEPAHPGGDALKTP